MQNNNINYWQRKENAREKISIGLRQKLLDKYKGMPVIVLRRKRDEILADNKAWVLHFLREINFSEYMVHWLIYFDYRTKESGLAVITNFLVFVEGN